MTCFCKKCNADCQCTINHLSCSDACLCKDSSNINLNDLEVIENAEDSEMDYDDDFSDEDKDSDSD